MKIQNISKLNTLQNSYPTKKPGKSRFSQNFGNSSTSLHHDILNNYNLALVSFKSNTDRVIEEFSKDNDYREKIAAALGCSPTALNSVLGANELRFLLLNQYRPENFLPGKENENVKSGCFTVNMHCHTFYSDGKMSPKQYLDSMAEYAKKIGKPVYCSITDHNNVRGTKEALKIIAEKPENYKNVRFIPGIEILMKHRWDDKTIIPLDFEVLAYCINPFDVKYNRFLDEPCRYSSANLNFEELSQLKDNDPSIIMGLSHPGKILLPPRKTFENFIDEFKKAGGEAIEAYYSYEEAPVRLLDLNIILASKYIGSVPELLKTGGRDNHGYSLFHRH